MDKAIKIFSGTPEQHHFLKAITPDNFVEKGNKRLYNMLNWTDEVESEHKLLREAADKSDFSRYNFNTKCEDFYIIIKN